MVDEVNGGYNPKKIISNFNEINNILQQGAKPKKVTSSDIRKAIKELAESTSNTSSDTNTAKTEETAAKRNSATEKEQDNEAAFASYMNMVETAIKRSKNYHLGKRQGNTRIIDADSVVWATPTKNAKKIKIGETTIYMPVSGENAVNYSNTTDGYIGDSAQAKRGDCYFLAEINSIRNTKEGQALLKKNCKKNKDGSYTVTLPGAQKIRRTYGRSHTCQVTGTYTISKEALEKAGLSSKYSNGDLEVVAYELAMEAYRAEMVQTNKANGNNKWDVTTTQGTVVKKNSSDYLSGGFAWDAGFILTGQKSEVFNSNNKRYNSVSPYKPGQYGFITREEMARRTGADISMYNEKELRAAATSTVSSYTQNERAINDMLNKYQGKEGEYAISFGVRVAKDGPDGTTKAGAGHMLSVLKITGDTVYVSNPWYPERVEPIPRNEFIKMCTSLAALPVGTSEISGSNNTKLSQLLDFINQKN